MMGDYPSLPPKTNFHAPAPIVSKWYTPWSAIPGYLSTCKQYCCQKISSASPQIWHRSVLQAPIFSPSGRTPLLKWKLSSPLCSGCSRDLVSMMMSSLSVRNAMFRPIVEYVDVWSSSVTADAQRNHFRTALHYVCRYFGDLWAWVSWLIGGKSLWVCWRAHQFWMY